MSGEVFLVRCSLEELDREYGFFGLIFSSFLDKKEVISPCGHYEQPLFLIKSRLLAMKK